MNLSTNFELISISDISFKMNFEGFIENFEAVARGRAHLTQLNELERGQWYKVVLFSQVEIGYKIFLLAILADGSVVPMPQYLSNLVNSQARLMALNDQQYWLAFLGFSEVFTDMPVINLVREDEFFGEDTAREFFENEE